MVDGADVFGGVTDVVVTTGGVELAVDGGATVVDAGAGSDDDVLGGGLLVVTGLAGLVVAEVAELVVPEAELGGVLPAEGALTETEPGPELELELPASPGPVGTLTEEFADVPALDGCAATTAWDGERFGLLDVPAAVLV